MPVVNPEKLVQLQQNAAGIRNVSEKNQIHLVHEN